MLDVLVIGSGPAGLSIAAALAEAGLAVQGLSPTSPETPWVNTYGIWVDELEALSLSHLLAHRWQDSVVFMAGQELPLQREYGLFDKGRLQQHWLGQCDQHRVGWRQGIAAKVQHHAAHTTITTQEGKDLAARLVVDVSGHKPALVQRPTPKAVAYQAAFGIVGRFSKPPITPQRMVLMDYRDDHLAPEERLQPPTFLYAMDLGDDLYFVEETSLAHAPAISFEVLERRLYQRLRYDEVEVTAIHEVEHCLFPMNLPLPDLHQPVVGFGGAASMVHPATGYMVGSLLRRGPILATAIAQGLGAANTSPTDVAHQAWQALWPIERRRKHYLYTFGLENLMDFSPPRLRRFFTTFFSLPQSYWSGFLADTLTFPELLQAMVVLFGKAPNDVRWGLMKSVAGHGDWLGRMMLNR
jgi:lycopene cyclase-like protein